MMFERKRVATVMLVLLTCAVMLLSACVPYKAPDDRVLVDLASKEDGDILPESEYIAENEYMTINTIVSVSPTNVAVCGQLKEKAIAAGVDSVLVDNNVNLTVHEKCVGDYFIVSVDLPGDTGATFAATAMKGDEPVCEPLTFAAPYDATAEDRLDGNGVSVGSDSRLFFTKYLSDYLSEELYTASQISDIKASVAATYRAYVERAKGERVALIYVFLPDITTMDPSILRDEDAAKKDPDLLTRYEQVVTAVGGTMANVVDMQTVLQAELDAGKDIYDLYRRTDSHPTEYASFLMYQEVMKYVTALDTDVVPYTLDDFDLQTVEVKGGDLVSYRELDPDIVTETITVLKPKFSYVDAVKSVKIYNDTINGDYSLNTQIVTTDNVVGGAERYEISTGRTELPNALIYRDENAIHASLMLASSFDRVLLGRADQKAINRYAISLTEATQFRDKAEGKPIADFIIVFVSESNLVDAFGTGS